jgi:hypothetical protein
MNPLSDPPRAGGGFVSTRRPRYAGLRQRLQKICEIDVRVPVTRAGRSAARREEGAGVGREGVDGSQQGERVRLSLVEHDTLPRHVRRRRDDAIQREPAEALVYVEEARERTGHRDRAHADVEDLFRRGKVDGRR